MESYYGFLFYFVFSFLTSFLLYLFRVRPAVVKAGEKDLSRFFKSSIELWTGGLLEGLSGFVLTWTLFYGLVSA